MMPTSLLMIQKKNKLQKGFTLIEILVALLLITLVLTMVTGGSYSNRDHLDEVISNIERAVRFSGDEAALKNTVMRVNFKLDETPQKYSVQFGPDGDFTISATLTASSKEARTSDEKRLKKANQKRDQQFNNVQEFSEGDREIHENIRLIGFGSSLFDNFVKDTAGAVYIYPSGEKDAAIIILGTDEEIATVKISPFTTDIDINYYPMEKDIPSDEFLTKQDELAMEYYKEWLKNQ